MGSKGSLHFYGKSSNIAKLIYEEYSNPQSRLNNDPTHNDFGTPLIVVNDNFVSIYDGSFAVCGDLYKEAKLLSKKVGKPIIGITCFEEMVGLFCVSEDKVITDALYMDGEWVKEMDARIFLETLCLPYQKYEIEELLDFEDADDFLIRFQNLTNLPFFLSEKYSYVDKSKFLRLDKSSKWANIYTKAKHINFSEDGTIE